MRQSITFIDGDSVRYTIARVKDNASSATRSIQGQNSLNCHIHGWRVKGFKHDLGHLFSVCLWIERCLSEEDRMLLRGNTQLIVEGVMPDLLHVIPVGDNSMFNRILES